jgi:hypothetical protein
MADRRVKEARPSTSGVPVDDPRGLPLVRLTLEIVERHLTRVRALHGER